MANQNIVLGLAALAFCVWVVSLAGLASLQDECTPDWGMQLSGLRGINALLPCYRLFRYYWFIIIFEFVATVGLIVAIVTGMYAKTRLSWMGWFAMTALLYFQSTDTFYSFTNLPLSDDGQLKHRARTMAAGCLMVSVVNSFVVFALGMTPDDTPAPAVEGKANAV